MGKFQVKPLLCMLPFHETQKKCEKFLIVGFLLVKICIVLCWRSLSIVQFFNQKKIWPLSVLSKIEITKNELKCAVSGADFPNGSRSKESSHKAGDTCGVVSIPGSSRSPGEGNGNPFQYSCLGNPMARGSWWAIAYGVAKSQTWLENVHTH